MGDSFGGGRVRSIGRHGEEIDPSSKDRASLGLGFLANTTEEESLKGIRYFIRNFTATAVKEHLRSQIEDTGGSPKLTPKEVELVRFIREAPVDWGSATAVR